MSGSRPSPWARFRGLVERMEEIPVGPLQLAAALAAIIAVRNLLELIVARNPVFEPLAAFVHYPLAYVAPFVALTLVLALWAGVAAPRVARLMLFAWLLTLLPPLADLVLHRSHDAPTIGYLHVDPNDLGWTWAHFFDPSVSLVGTTPGIRIEILAAVLLAALYVALRSGSWWRALLGAVTTYLVSLFFLSLMVLVHALFRLGNPALTRTEFLWGNSLLNRPGSASAPDSSALMWLGFTLAGLGVVWWLAEARDLAPRWVRGHGGPSDAPGLVFLLLSALAAGVVAAFWLHLPMGQSLIVAPYDFLALPGSLLALGLVASPLLRPSADPFVRLAPLALGLSMIAGLGPNVAVPVAAAVLPLPLLYASWLPGPARRALQLAVPAVSTLAAVAAGYALVVGREALGRVPVDLLLLGLVAGAGYGLLRTVPRAAWWARPLVLAIAFGIGSALVGGTTLALVGAVLGGAVGALAGWAERGPDPEEGTPGLWTGVLAGIVLVVLARAAVSVPALLDPLKEEARCVARLHVIRAQEFEEKKEWLNAKPQYFEALKCDENDLAALRGLALGLLANEEGKTERAIELLEKAAALAPDSPSDLSNLASAYIRTGRPAEALPLLEKAVRSDPRDPNILFNHARALEDLGRREEAIAAWESFLARAESLPESAPDLRIARQQLRALRDGTSP